MRRSIGVIVAALLLVWAPVTAQITAPEPLVCVIVIIHEVLPDRVWIIAPEYLLGPANPGEFVAVGFGTAGGTTILQQPVSAQIMLLGTEIPVAELGPLAPDATVTSHLTATDPSREWTGFLAPVLAPLPGSILVDLHIDVDVGPITSIAQLSQEAMDTGFGSGGADAMGNPLPPPFDLRNPTDVTVIDERTPAPPVIGALSVSDPWPNPASSRVAARLSLVPDAAYRLTVYDLRGRRVRAWMGTGPRGGETAWSWNLLSTAGTPVASGTYVIRLEQGGAAVTRTMVRIR